MLLFLLSGSFSVYGQERVQSLHSLKAGDKVRFVIANFSSAPHDTLFLLLIPPVFSPVFVSNENESVLAIPVIINSSVTHFSPVTTVEYSISAQGKVELKAFDSSGKQVYITGDERSRNIPRCQKFRPVILNVISIN